MSEQNKALVRRWFDEVWNQGREDAVDELLAADGVGHGVGAAPLRGPGDFKPLYRAFRSAFRDIRVTVEEAVAEGDLVAVRCRDELTLHDGRTCTIEGGGMVRIRDGQIVEAWNQWNFLDLLEQMGAVPSNALSQALSRAGAERGGGRPGA